MQDTDPFQDQAFVARLGKLLPMLASEQPGEAEAARRKLLEHLAHSRVGLTDLMNRLRDTRRLGALGSSEEAMERQLRASREARADAEVQIIGLTRRNIELEHALGTAPAALPRAAVAERVIGGAGWVVALVALGSIAFRHFAELPQDVALRAVPPPQMMVQAPDPVDAPAPGGRIGTVAVQDLVVRLAPSDEAGVRAFLNRGTRVLIEQQVRVGVQNWLMIRSGTGEGWVRAGDIVH